MIEMGSVRCRDCGSLNTVDKELPFLIKARICIDCKHAWFEKPKMPNVKGVDFDGKTSL